MLVQRGLLERVLGVKNDVNSSDSYYENSPEAFVHEKGQVALAGLGIGLLATAAIALAPTVSDLATTGAQVVRQAFRLGVLVNEVSQNLQLRESTDTSTPEAWAYVLPNVTAKIVQEELDLIHAEEVSKKRKSRS